MPKIVDLKEIAEKNPNLDLSVLEEWRKLQESLPEGEEISRRGHSEGLPFKGRRARIVDDADSDPRLIRLQRRA